MDKAHLDIKILGLMALLFIFFSTCGSPVSPPASSTASQTISPTTTTSLIPTSTATLSTTYTPTPNLYKGL